MYTSGQREQFDIEKTGRKFVGRLLCAFVAFAANQGTALAAEPEILTSLLAVHRLSNQEANSAVPVAFEATVVYSRGYESLLFVQDDDAALFVRPPSTSQWIPGDRIFIQGKTQGSFRPLVVASSITLAHHGQLPPPAQTTWSQMIQAQLDARLAVVRARVHAADLVVSPASPVRSARLQLLMEGGHLEAYVDCDNEAALKDLLDADVEITGAVAGKFDDKMEQTGIVLYVSKLADIRVLKHATTSPWSMSVMAMDQILGESEVRDLTRRVRIAGTITYYQPGSAVVLESGSKSLWISTQTREPLEIGDFADATGFPSARDRVLTLTDGEIRDSHVQRAVTPQLVSWGQLAVWNSSKPMGHQYDLVSIDGQIITEVREASQDEYVLSTDGRLFTAIYRHSRTSAPLLPMRQVPLGSRARITGICSIPDTHAINPGEEVPFDILLRSYDDIAIIANPSWLSVRNLLALVSMLIALLFVAGARSWVVDRKVRRQNATAAYMERRRARILEDINSSRPLVEILEDITQLVSFKLQSIPCWIQIVDGARLGICPPDLSKFRVAQQQVQSRTAPSLGTIYAAFDVRSSANGEESEVLFMAAALAALAIDTKRLYADLVHRSEFDLLTNIHNRFSFEQYMDLHIERMHDDAGLFALIYIDLNDFKHVNDFYGHLVGDLYLREAAARMKKQLRSHDMLARLGGDEFVVLVPDIRNPMDVEEVAHRLERSFDDQFVIKNYILHGSASFGIALYPEDGTTKDALFMAADAAMYVSKHSKKGAEEQAAVGGDIEANSKNLA
jgi:diguanylate cyclase (GGDEF)-like protein